MEQLIKATVPVAPLQTRRPADLASVHAALGDARELDASVLVHGGLTKIDWGAQPASPRPWLVVDTTRLTGIVRHDAGDMTATVLAGTPLAEVQRHVAAAGQELAIDPPDRGGAPTVGGVLAANDAGPRRFRYGGIRDLVIGTTAVLSDGSVSRSGGTVIKNVAGYDLGKLWCGSLGTLGVVVEVTVRLHPRPEARRTITIAASAAAATELATNLLASPVECAVIEWSSTAGAMLISLEGRAAGLGGQVDRLAEVARHTSLDLEDAGDDALSACRDAHAGRHGATSVARAATLPSELAGVAGDLADAAESSEVDAELHSHAGLGLHDAVLSGGTPAEHARIVAEWRRRVRLRGGRVVLRDRVPGVADHLDPWDEPASPRLLELTRALKDAVDPDARMAPGRFAGGI